MDGIVDRRFGLKVLAGIVLGCAVGAMLLIASPVGLHPGDRVELTTTSGATHTVSLEATPTDPRVAKLVAEPPIRGLPEKMATLGLPADQFRREIAQATGTPIETARVVSRGDVTLRPWTVELLHVAGQLFMRLLRMLVVPLLLVTVLVGIASVGSIGRLGRLGLQASIWMVGTMFVAVAIGLTAVNILRP